MRTVIIRCRTTAAANHQVQQALDDITDGLEGAIEAAQRLKRLEPSVRGVLEAYTIPWLRSFIEDRNQSGSVADVKRRLHMED